MKLISTQLSALVISHRPDVGEKDNLPETKEQIQPVCFFCNDLSVRVNLEELSPRTKVPVQLGIHDPKKLLQSGQLLLHSALITQEVLFLRQVEHDNSTLVESALTILFITSTKHQNVISSSPFMTTYIGALKSDIPCT